MHAFSAMARFTNYAVFPPTLPTVPVVMGGDALVKEETFVDDDDKQQEVATADDRSGTNVARANCAVSNAEGEGNGVLSFPVRRIYCVGRNYADHALEMGGDPTRESPFFFCKPADAVVPCGRSRADRNNARSSSRSNNNTTKTKENSDTTAAEQAEGDIIEIPYPLATSDLHHEIELVVALGRAGRQVSVDDAPALIYGYAVGVDLTRRDLQAVAKRTGRPWCAAKGFDMSAPIGNIHPATKSLTARLLQRPDENSHRHADGAFRAPPVVRAEEEEALLWLNVNGQRRQEGRPASQLLWSVPEIVSILSHHFELRPGDLIYTGTPAGVAALRPGDRVAAGMDGLGELGFRIGSAGCAR